MRYMRDPTALSSRVSKKSPDRKKTFICNCSQSALQTDHENERKNRNDRLSFLDLSQNDSWQDAQLITGVTKHILASSHSIRDWL
jgi:hypothetical protein